MYQSMNISEFEQLQKRNSLTIIDVREENEFVSGHIPEAVNLPLSEIVEKVETLSTQEDYYIICQSGGRSEQASRFLAQKGYQVINVMGGMSAWRGESVDGL